MNNDLDRVTKALIYFGVLAFLAVGFFIQGALFADTRAMTLFMGILLMVSSLSLFVWKNYLWPSWGERRYLRMENKEKNQGVNRRQFIGLLGLAPLAAALTIPLGATGKYLEPPASLTAPPQPMLLSGVAQLEVGSVKNFNYNNTSAVLMKKSDKDYTAFYRRCTHLGCTVEWDPNEKIFLCPCHGGKFDAEGKNIYGPPPKPLIALKVTVQNNDKIQIEEKEA